MEEGLNLVLYAPVPYADGAATFICKLPTDYPVEPVRADGIEIEGIQPELESTLLAILQLQGLVYCESVEYHRSGDPILFDLISAIREALAWQLTEEMMEELVAEAEATPEEDIDDHGSDGSDTMVDSVDWQKYELKKKAAADARRRATQQVTGLVDEPEVPGKLAKPTLTGNAAWKARLQAGETVSFRGGQ